MSIKINFLIKAIMVLILTSSPLLQSCSTSSSSEIVEVKYQCPMQCEEDKTYIEEGTCPVCKMNLEKL